MATLRNKEKLAAVSRETPEDTKSSESQNTLDPGMAQETSPRFLERLKGGSQKNYPNNSAGRSTHLGCFVSA